MKVLKCFILCFLFVSVGTAHAAIPVDLDDIVITPSRMAQRNYKIAGNVTVIDREQIEHSSAQTVADVLKEAVGVNIYDNGTAKSAVVDIRGFGDTASRNVLVLVDDRKINSADISGPELVQIPLESVERIEVLRGAGSVLYGDNAVGGVVNIITKKGKGDFKGRVGTTYGSYDARSVDVEGSGSKKGLSYYLYSKYDDARGYRSNSDALRKDYNSRLAYDFSDKVSTRVDIGWHEENQRLPSGLLDAELAALGPRGSAHEDDFANTKDRFFKLGFDVKPWPEDIEWGKFVLDLDYRNRDVFDILDFGGGFRSGTKRNIDTYGATGKYIFDHEVFDHDVNFITGVDYYNTKNDILGSESNSDDLTIKKEEVGVFGFAQYEAIDNLYVKAGTRYHQALYDFKQRNIPVDSSRRPDVSVSNGGLRYEYAPGSNIHASAQQTFRFLSTDEWYSQFPPAGLNLFLDQQEGVQYEAGIKHDFNNAVVVSVTPYQIDLRREIYVDPTNGQFGSNSNYDQTRRRGVEVGQQTDLLKFFSLEKFDKLEFFTNYSYENAEFVNGIYDGKDIPMVPNHQVNGGLTFGFFKNYNVSLIGHFVGERFAINDTNNVTPPIKPYAIMDTKLSYDRDAFEFFFALNNIFDEKYYSFVSKSTSGIGKSYSPAPERNFTMGASVKF